MSRLVRCDFVLRPTVDLHMKCEKTTDDVVEAGFYRVFTPDMKVDDEGDPESVILDFCGIAHLAGWALRTEAGIK